MTLCPICSLQLSTDSGACPHHLLGADDWSTGNRIYCDFFHRGKVAARLPNDERFFDLTAYAGGGGA